MSGLDLSEECASFLPQEEERELTTEEIQLKNLLDMSENAMLSLNPSEIDVAVNRQEIWPFSNKESEKEAPAEPEPKKSSLPKQETIKEKVENETEKPGLCGSGCGGAKKKSCEGVSQPPPPRRVCTPPPQRRRQPERCVKRPPPRQRQCTPPLKERSPPPKRQCTPPQKPRTPPARKCTPPQPKERPPPPPPPPPKDDCSPPPPKKVCAPKKGRPQRRRMPRRERICGPMMPRFPPPPPPPMDHCEPRHPPPHRRAQKKCTPPPKRWCCNREAPYIPQPISDTEDEGFYEGPTRHHFEPKPLRFIRQWDFRHSRYEPDHPYGFYGPDHPCHY